MAMKTGATGARTGHPKAAAVNVSSTLRHDPEKWEPLFGKDHAQTRSWFGMTIRGKIIPL
jgi:hypothetical protein